MSPSRYAAVGDRVCARVVHDVGNPSRARVLPILSLQFALKPTARHIAHTAADNVAVRITWDRSKPSSLVCSPSRAGST